MSARRLALLLVLAAWPAAAVEVELVDSEVITLPSGEGLQAFEFQFPAEPTIGA